MQNDEVILLVEHAHADKFVSYTIDTELYSPEGSFQFECDSKYEVNKGDSCEIFVNRKRVMKGLVDSVRRSLSRSGPKLEIEGRSVASVLADSSVTNFGTLPTTLPALAESWCATFRLSPGRILFSNRAPIKSRSRESLWNFLRRQRFRCPQEGGKFARLPVLGFSRRRTGL